MAATTAYLCDGPTAELALATATGTSLLAAPLPGHLAAHDELLPTAARVCSHHMAADRLAATSTVSGDGPRLVAVLDRLLG